MRIVHLVVTDAFAGVERHVTTLAAHQFDHGHRVTVLGCDAEQFRAAVAGRPVAHHGAASLAAAARALTGTERPDVLHVHMTAAEIVAALSPRHVGVPLVATRHFAQHRGSSRPAKLIGGLAARRIAAQIAVSRHVAEHIEGASVVVPAGVAPQPLPDPASRDRIVLVAQRLEAEKATDVALHAFARSGLRGDGWRLAVAGAGALEGPLRALAADLGIGEATDFLGHRHDVDALMRDSGLLLAPCPAEGLGITVLEAMSHGLPVVAAAAGGHLETAGRAPAAALFPVGDAAAAARQLGRLAADPRARAAYGEQLWRVQREGFTPQSQAAAVERVYRSIL
ncbi:MAG: glycosyltransferase family 4 protein [Tetrasphaera sp.]